VHNLVYALIQVIHNLGAVTVVSTAASALWLVCGNVAVQHRLAILLAVAWTIQAASGAGFGIATYSFEGHLPDIHGTALAALFIKIVCAFAGFILAVTYVMAGAKWAANEHVLAWKVSLALGITALGSAAFLRWFS